MGERLRSCSLSIGLKHSWNKIISRDKVYKGKLYMPAYIRAFASSNPLALVEGIGTSWPTTYLTVVELLSIHDDVAQIVSPKKPLQACR